MNADRFENIGIVTRLIRKQRTLRERPVQFTLSLLLLGTGYLACLLWFIQFVVRTQPFGMPIFMHVWFLLLWTNLIGGVLASHDARWYILGGTIGLCLASPVLVTIYIHDLEPVVLFTGWACSFAFAMFANLGGALWCVRHDRVRRAALNATIFVCSIMIFAVRLLRY